MLYSNLPVTFCLSCNTLVTTNVLPAGYPQCSGILKIVIDLKMEWLVIVNNKIASANLCNNCIDAFIKL
jgi:hypothetical protein